MSNEQSQVSDVSVPVGLAGGAATMDVQQAAHSDFLQPARIRCILRKLTARKLAYLIESGKVHTIPDPAHEGRRLASLSDTRAIVMRRKPRRWAAAKYFEIRFGVKSHLLSDLVEYKFVAARPNPDGREGSRLYSIPEFLEWKRLKDLMDADPRGHDLGLVPGFASYRYFEDEHEIGRASLYQLGESGAVGRISHPVVHGNLLYNIADFEAWDQDAVVEYPPGDTFFDEESGKTFLWMNALERREPYKSRYRARQGTISDWARLAPGEPGCELLGGEHPIIITLRKRGQGGTPRDYVDIDFLDRMVAAEQAAKTAGPKKKRKSRSNWITLRRVNRLGMSTKTAIAYSDSPYKKLAPKKHHAFSPPRPFKTKVVKRVHGRQSIRAIRWWEPDILAAVEADGPDPQFWGDRACMNNEYQIADDDLDYFAAHATPELGGQKMTARRFARKPESHKSTHPKFWWKPHARKLAAVLGGKTRTEVREQAHKQTKTTTIPLKATPNPVKGLLLRGVDEFPFINGRPAKRKLKAVEYEVLKFMAGKHADGYQRLFYADIDVGIYKSRTRALRFLAEDPEFGPFVSVPGSRKNKNKGYALIGVQVF